jgi:hypothetical protein
MKTQRGVKYNYTILKSRYKMEVGHVLTALLLGKIPRHPSFRMLGGPQSRSGRYGEEKHLVSPPGVPNPRSSGS